MLQRTSAGVALAAALLGTAIGSGNNSVASVALPGVLREFPGTSVSDGTWLITGYILATAVLVPIAGRMIDFWGTRHVFANAFLLYSAGSLLCAASGSFPQLMAGRVLQGIAGAPVLPAVFVTVRTCFDRERQGRPLGIWAAVNGASLSSAPLIGGVLVQAFEWRAIFWVQVPLALLIYVAVRRLMPDLGRSASGRFDLVGGVLFASSLLGFMLVLSQAPKWGLTSPTLLAAALVTATLLVTYVVTALRSDSPFFDLRLFRQRAYTALTLVSALQMAALFGVFFAIPLLVVDYLELSATAAGALIALTPLVSTLTAPVVGGLADRVGRRLPLVGGGTLLCTGGLLLTLAASGRIVLLGFALALLGLGVGLIMSPSASGITHGVDAERSGVALGAFNTARFTGGVAGATIFTLLYEHVAGIPPEGSLAQASSAALLPAFRSVFYGIAGLGVTVVLIALTLQGHCRVATQRDH